MNSKNKWSFGLLPDSVEYAEKQNYVERLDLDKLLDLKDVIKVDFPNEQYYRKQTTKKQIVLHHTVSGHGVNGDLNWWLQTKGRIATHMIVDFEGKIYQCYSTKYWAHHLGVKKSNNVALNKASIGVEIDAWGGLVKRKGKWYPSKWDAVKKVMVANIKVKPIKNVQEYPEGWRGYYGFEKYTSEQIESVRKLLVYWGEVYNIPLGYNEDMWDISENALSGKSGVWSHVSYREDKSDCHPQPELIKMLKSI